LKEGICCGEKELRIFHNVKWEMAQYLVKDLSGIVCRGKEAIGSMIRKIRGGDVQ
jgi:hypothetical protein